MPENLGIKDAGKPVSALQELMGLGGTDQHRDAPTRWHMLSVLSPIFADGLYVGCHTEVWGGARPSPAALMLLIVQEGAQEAEIRRFPAGRT